MAVDSDTILGLIYFFLPIIAGFVYSYTNPIRENKTKLLKNGAKIGVVLGTGWFFYFVLTERPPPMVVVLTLLYGFQSLFSIVGTFIGNFVSLRKKRDSEVVSSAPEPTSPAPKPEPEKSTAVDDDDRRLLLKYVGLGGVVFSISTLLWYIFVTNTGGSVFGMPETVLGHFLLEHQVFICWAEFAE